MFDWMWNELIEAGTEWYLDEDKHPPGHVSNIEMASLYHKV